MRTLARDWSKGYKMCVILPDFEQFNFRCFLTFIIIAVVH